MTTAKPADRTRDLSRIIGIVLASVGLIDATYLSWLHISSGNALLCTAGGGCDIVQNSAWSEISGVPIAFFGAAGYLFILGVLLLDHRLGEWGPILLLGASLIGTLYSAFLTYIELFVIYAICPYCVASALFMLGLLVVSFYRFGKMESGSPAR